MDNYEPPDFCDRCGAPFPWVSRQGRVWHLENLLDEHGDLDEATKLRLHEELDALIADPDTEQAKRWRRVRDLAGTAWDKSGAQTIFVTLVTEATKQQLR